MVEKIFIIWLKIYTTLGYIVSLILLNLGHMFRFRIVSRMCQLGRKGFRLNLLEHFEIRRGLKTGKIVTNDQTIFDSSILVNPLHNYFI